MNTPTLTITAASCADDYDPDSMPVAKARAFIHQFLAPIEGTVRVPIRSALGRVLAEDVLSPVDVPAHRNSAMDGWAMRGADLMADAETTLQEIGASFAGKPFGGRVAAGQCVRIMTGGVVPEGADTVVMQERAKASGKSVTFTGGQKTGQNVREAGEDLKKGTARSSAQEQDVEDEHDQ
jgi:molybdopterin molybdotransferase